MAGSASERGCPLKLTLPPPKSGPAPPRKETIGYVRRETIARVGTSFDYSFVDIPPKK